ncbi:MAG: R3H domain-containing nucleic acid-binding protein [Fimbriimonadaceae bacterium]
MSRTTEGITELLDVLPAVLREKLLASPDINDLVEVVLDYGRPAEARYMSSVERWPGTLITAHDIEHVVKNVGEFGGDNRAGIERTLHRISCIRNRGKKVIGLTCRVGRALEGTIDIIDDIVRSGNSILILGRPGIGKTTKLREVARVLADEVNRRVVIVDTSNEIGGDGDVPHPAVGTARRMQVPNPSEQHAVMIEAVENHMPEVIVIDEIGNQAEAEAARTIAERGVQLIATAHGQTLENLMLNPSLCDLVGGIQAVTLSDDEARRRGTQKTVLERKAPPTFDVVIELVDYDRLAVHHNVQRTVDLMLRGVQPKPEIRVRTASGQVEVVPGGQPETVDEPGFDQPVPSLARTEPKPEASVPPVRIYPFGIARTRLERAIRERQANAVITGDPQHADAVIALRWSSQARPGKLRETSRSIPTVVVRSNAFSAISSALDEVLQGRESSVPSGVVDEVHAAIETVIQTGKPVELAPRDAPARKVQHQIVESRHLASEAVGREPNRRLRVLPVRVS